MPEVKGHKVEFAKDPYLSLPAVVQGERIITEWELTDEERDLLAVRGRLRITLIGTTLQPLLPEAIK